MDYSTKNILAIDCSSSELKLGFQFGGDRMVKSAFPAEQSHSVLIMKSIANLLESANCKVSDINAIVVATGPGSFTGLRIGIACAKGMASALGIPVVGVSLLDLSVYKLAGLGKDIKVVFPFKKGSYFVADLANGVINQSEIKVVTQEELKAHLNGKLAAGIGEIDLGKLVETKEYIVDSGKTAFDATELIYIGIERLNQNKIEDLAKLEPLYLQKSQAEIKFEQNRNRQS
ncbi:MAG TPA: tRNA (adenosine(37)-N6)-threonylcarbamoyltransferase complex dimerization subunit type 1 TsaB [candidate division Zixibacteria bacterium]|nr:tRNA (adenosine(37)-N6)-threonylcarbamoyltransferase complex dimerization subunit type 1 TsaB [candidate division Zixibacteria bacterium]